MKIDAREFRVGNLYSQFGNTHEVTWVTIKELENAPDEQLWFKPIQLTEEWFISCQSNSIFNNGFDYKKTSTGRFEVYIGVHLVTVIEFVHELQNLNFALLGEDVVFSDNIL